MPGRSPEAPPGVDVAGVDLARVGLDSAIADVLSARAVRERSHELLDAAERGQLEHFRIEDDRLGDVAQFVAAITRERYPTLVIPFHSRWRHFEVGGEARWEMLRDQIGGDPMETGRASIDLVVTSVLLDAGAGAAWRYREQNGAVHARSEGLGVASFDAFARGAFSAHPDDPLRADAAGLQACTAQRLGGWFQVSNDNPLIGLDGRAGLVRALGRAVGSQPGFFGSERPRIGNLCDYFVRISDSGRLPAAAVLGVVLDALGSIWPGREHLGGVNLGDVWRHPAIRRDDDTNALMPFHKLSQWLTYSLLEPLAWAGLEVTELDGLTGLAEYRNGGLMVDLGLLLAPRNDALLSRAHDPGATEIVEWRALTVALLDRLAPLVRQALGKDTQSLPLASILEGGTWAAGRRAAAERRNDGGPPIQIRSDGTLF